MVKRVWRWIRQNVQFEGPSPGLIHYGRGRIFQIRYKQDRLKFRLDYAKMKGSGNKPRLHINLEVGKKNIHIPLDARRFFDD